MWKVRRRWLPHREGKGVRARFQWYRGRRRQRAANRAERRPVRAPKEGRRWYDAIDPLGGCGDGLDDLAIVLVAIVVLLLLIFVVPPLVLLGIDLLWLAFAFLAGAIGRFVLGRPWRVEAVGPDGERRDWFVKGFRGAGQLRDTLQAEFDAGLNPHPDVTTG